MATTDTQLQTTNLDAPTTPPGREIIAIDKEIGQSGTFLVNGYLNSTDHNLLLTGLSGILIYDQMRKSDATVRISLQALLLPILAAHWNMEPFSDSEQDKLIANFITDQLLSGNNPNLSWRHFVEESNKMEMAYGRMFYEKVFALADFEGKTYIGWKKFAPRHPRTISRYSMENGNPGISQTLIPAGGPLDIPWEKLMVFVHEMEGENLEGFSVLRSAYMHWSIKDRLYKIDAIGLERQGLGIPYAIAKDGYTPSDKERSMIRIALMNLRAGNEKAFLEIPAGYEVGWMDMKSHTARMPKDSIDHHDRQIVKNVMAQFIEIGGTRGGGGSLAASDNQMDLFVLALQAQVNHFKEVVQHSINQLININWPGYKKYPTLKADKIGPDNNTKLADVLLKLVEGRMLTPTDDDEILLRDMLEMPDLPEELLGTIDRSPLPPSPGLQDAGGNAQDPATDPSDQKSKKPTKKQASEIQTSEIARLADMVEKALYG